MTEETKRCSLCRETRPLTDYYKWRHIKHMADGRNKPQTGYRSRCKFCCQDADRGREKKWQNEMKPLSEEQLLQIRSNCQEILRNARLRRPAVLRIRKRVEGYEEKAGN